MLLGLFLVLGVYLCVANRRIERKHTVRRSQQQVTRIAHTDKPTTNSMLSLLSHSR